MVKAMRTVVYNIPVHLVPAYRGREVVVRFQDPAELVQALPDSDIEKLVSVQLLSLTAAVDALADWGYGVPVELIMRSPATEFSLLYRHAKLLDKHPVRVSIPVLPGLFKAVKVASALRFPVKLDVGQPEPDTIEALQSVLDFYLHHPSVSQPVEFFHTSLLSFYNQAPVPLWDVQEDDPAYVRYVTEFPRPVEVAAETRFKIAGMYETRGEQALRYQELREIVALDAAAGADRTDRTKYLAAQSGLVLSQPLYAEFADLRLTQPFEQSLATKR